MIKNPVKLIDEYFLRGSLLLNGLNATLMLPFVMDSYEQPIYSQELKWVKLWAASLSTVWRLKAVVDAFVEVLTKTTLHGVIFAGDACECFLGSLVCLISRISWKAGSCQWGRNDSISEKTTFGSLIMPRYCDLSCPTIWQNGQIFFLFEEFPVCVHLLFWWLLRGLSYILKNVIVMVLSTNYYCYG